MAHLNLDRAQPGELFPKLGRGIAAPLMRDNRAGLEGCNIRKLAQ
jgi:hypothetical protein